MTSLVGSNVAGMVFDAAKSVDRVTITVYQSAAGNNILTWLQNAVDRLISALGNAIYFPYLAPVVILGAIWLAWQGLIRKRATRTIEGTLWMVVATAALQRSRPKRRRRAGLRSQGCRMRWHTCVRACVACLKAESRLTRLRPPPRSKPAPGCAL